jgi:hypothetical protein
MKNLFVILLYPLFSLGISFMVVRPLPCEPLVDPLKEEGRYVS